MSSAMGKGWSKRWSLGYWLLIISSIFILLKLPTLTLPFYYDELYVVAAGWDILHNRFYPIPQSANLWGHPPVVYELVALAWFLVGPRVWVLHLLMVVFAIITLSFTYLVGKSLWGERVGFTAAAMLAACPLFFAQAGILSLDFPATTFAIVALYGLIQEQWPTYILSASFMILSKETSIVLIPLMAGFARLRAAHLPPRTGLKRATLGAVPLLSFALWIAFHKVATGFWSGNPAWVEVNTVILRYNLEMGILKRFAIRWIQVLESNHHFVVALVFVLGLAKAAYKRSFGEREGQGGLRSLFVDKAAEAFVVAALIIFLLFHSVFGLLQHHYLLPILPLFFLLAARGLDYLLEKRILYSLCVIIPILLLGWFKPVDRFTAPTSSLDYIHNIRTLQALLKYLETNHVEKTILSRIPEIYVQPIGGYVAKPLKIRPTDDYDLKGTPSDPQFDLVVYSFPMDGPLTERVWNIVRKYHLREIKRFGSDGYLFVIFGKD